MAQNLQNTWMKLDDWFENRVVFLELSFQKIMLSNIPGIMIWLRVLERTSATVQREHVAESGENLPFYHHLLRVVVRIGVSNNESNLLRSS